MIFRCYITKHVVVDKQTVYVFDKNLRLAYRGQLDDSRPGNEIPVTGKDLRNALDCLIENIENTEIQKPSIGCNIKWKD